MSLIEDVANLVSAGAAAATTITTGKANRRGAKLARELNDSNQQFQREINDLNWQRALQSWNMENDYNSPSSQMARYQQAGLNPNLIYQQENTASDLGAPEAVAPQSSMDEAQLASRAPDFLPLMTAAQSAVSNYQAADLRREEIEKLRLLNQNQAIVNKYLDQKEYLSAERAKRELRSVELDVTQKEFDQSFEQRMNLLINQKLDVQKKVQDIRESDLSISQKKQTIANLEQAFRQNAELQGYRVAAAYFDNMKKQFELSQSYKYVDKMNSIKLRQAYIELAGDEFVGNILGDPTQTGKGDALVKTFLVILQKLLK